KYLAKNIDLVDSLAGENSFAEQILIDIRNGLRVNVKAGLPRKEVGQSRAIHGLYADADTRLEDAITVFDGFRDGIDECLVQRMSHRTDQARCGTPRQLGVRIQRNHEADAAQTLHFSHFDWKPIFAVA